MGSNPGYLLKSFLLYRNICPTFFSRLTGSYAFIIFFLSTVWKHCDSGPFHYGELEADACSKASWINLLYINNFDLKYLEDQGSVSIFLSFSDH